MREVMPLAATPDAAAMKRAGAALKPHAIDGARQMVLVDGVFAPDLSDLANLEDGLTIRTLREALEFDGAQLQPEDLSSEASSAMMALNTAMMTDGLVIMVAKDVALKRPLHIVHVASVAQPASMFTRSLVMLSKGANATLVESYIATEDAKAYQVHDALSLAIGDGARLDQCAWSRTAARPSIFPPRS